MRILPAHKMPPDACRTLHALVRQPPEDGDQAVPLDQFHHKGRRRAAVRQQEDMASRPGQGDIEQTPLLGIGVLLRRREDKVEQRVVGDLCRKPVSSRAQAQHHDEVRLKPFRTMRGRVSELKVRMPPGKTGKVSRPHLLVPAQQQRA